MQFYSFCTLHSIYEFYNRKAYPYKKTFDIFWSYLFYTHFFFQPSVFPTTSFMQAWLLKNQCAEYVAAYYP